MLIYLTMMKMKVEKKKDAVEEEESSRRRRQKKTYCNEGMLSKRYTRFPHTYSEFTTGLLKVTREVL